MSKSTIARRKSSPCCIGCVVLVVIALGFSAAIGIYAYRFAKDNVSLIQVAGKTDPDLDVAPEVLFPQTVGDFSRISLMDSLENVPETADIATSGAHVAVYEDENTNSMTVIAVSTVTAKEQRGDGIGVLTMGRGKANSSNTGISIRDPFSGEVPRTIVTWSKANWTFMVQTTSTLAASFVENFSPGGVIDIVPAGDRETTDTVDMADDVQATDAVEMAPMTETVYN